MIDFLMTAVGLILLDDATTDNQRVIAGAILGVGLMGAVNNIRGE